MNVWTSAAFMRICMRFATLNGFFSFFERAFATTVCSTLAPGQEARALADGVTEMHVRPPKKPMWT